MFHLEQPAADVFAEVQSKSEAGKDREWLRLPIGEDFQFLDPTSVDLVEGVKVGEDRFLRVHFSRHDGAAFYADADFDDKLLDKVSALIVERPPAPAAGAPVPLRRG